MHLLTQSALLKALGWSLLNSLWQMALLWLLYRVVLSLLPKLSARGRHGLAILLLGTGMVWAALSGTSPWPEGIFQAGASSWESSFWQAGRNLINETLPYGSALYLVVLMTLFIRYIHQYLQSRQLKTAGLSKIQPELRVFVTKTSRLMSIRREVRVWLSSRVEVPVTLGFLKPVILIPLATVTNLSLPQVEAVLLHELAHIKRNDYLLHLGVTVLEVLFFFNPFSRWLIRDIQREREHCCDDMVIQFRYDPPTYVAALLSLATTAAGSRGSRQLVLAATGSNDQLLLKRVRRILQIREARERPGARTLILLLFMLAGSFLLLSRSAYPGSRGLSENMPRLSYRDELFPLPENTVKAGSSSENSVSSESAVSRSGNPGSSGGLGSSGDPVSSGDPASSGDPGSSGNGAFLSGAAIRADNIFPIGPVLGRIGYGNPVNSNASNISGDISRERLPVVTNTSLAAYTIEAKAPLLATRPGSGRHDRSVVKAAPEPDDDPAPDNAVALTGENDGPDVAPAEEAYASNVQVYHTREYSMAPTIGITMTAPAPASTPLVRSQPFVPNSSWSFQQTEDTAKLIEQYAYLQSLASHDVEEAVKKMQKQLQVQLRMLRQTQSREQRATLEAQRQLLEEQLKLQESFLRKQQELERKLERAGKVRRIVVI